METQQTAKEVITNIITSQPDDSTYEEIMRELSFELMVERGIEDSKKDRVISNEDMQHRIRTWQQ